MRTSRADRTETQPIPRIRASYQGDPMSMRFAEAIQGEPLESKDYTSYYRAIIILLVCILTTVTALTVVSFWGSTQTAQMNQLQQCMSRINPDANTNYQLETYKCMNGN